MLDAFQRAATQHGVVFGPIKRYRATQDGQHLRVCEAQVIGYTEQPPKDGNEHPPIGTAFQWADLLDS